MIISEVYSDMCDVKKYEGLYTEMKKLTHDDTIQLVLEASNEEEKEFFELVGDFFLQKEQQKCIERNVF